MSSSTKERKQSTFGPKEYDFSPLMSQRLFSYQFPLFSLNVSSRQRQSEQAQNSIEFRKDEKKMHNVNRIFATYGCITNTYQENKHKSRASTRKKTYNVIDYNFLK